MSFSAGTKVLLASGAAVPISQLVPDDKVLATNVKTGKTQAEPVTAVLVHHDTDLDDLRVITAHGTAVIQTTSSHLFWDPASSKWMKAGALRYGTHLPSPRGASVTALSGSVPADATAWMWDLTITADHDFYIDTIIGSVLVHNCDINNPQSKARQGQRRSKSCGITDGMMPDRPVMLEAFGGDCRTTPPTRSASCRVILRIRISLSRDRIFDLASAVSNMDRSRYWTSNGYRARSAKPPCRGLLLSVGDCHSGARKAAGPWAGNREADSGWAGRVVRTQRGLGAGDRLVGSIPANA